MSADTDLVTNRPLQMFGGDAAFCIHKDSFWDFYSRLLFPDFRLPPSFKVQKMFLYHSTSSVLIHPSHDRRFKLFILLLY